MTQSLILPYCFREGVCWMS